MSLNGINNRGIPCASFLRIDFRKQLNKLTIEEFNRARRDWGLKEIGALYGHHAI